MPNPPEELSTSPTSPTSPISRTSPNTQHPTPNTPSPLIPVFVYGTLKPGETYHAAYCDGRVARYEDAIAQGQLYALPFGYPAMTQGNDIIYGYLLWLKDSTALQALDELEDYDPQRPASQNEYNRIWVEIFTPTHTPLGFAWVYQMTKEQVQSVGGVLLPQGSWSSQENYF